MSATKIQIETIQARRVDDTAREMMRDGVVLTHEQADQIGDEGHAWIRTRLGLVQATDDVGVTYSVGS